MDARNKDYFQTQGYSMWPFLRPQDRIIVEKAEFHELCPGELVVYEYDGRSVCHRLVKKKISLGKSWLFIRGDYVPSWRTEKVDPSKVTGRVSAIVRGSRIVPTKGLTYTLTGRMIVLVFPLLALAVSRIEKILKKR
jgi:hypothetical protein